MIEADRPGPEFDAEFDRLVGKAGELGPRYAFDLKKRAKLEDAIMAELSEAGRTTFRRFCEENAAACLAHGRVWKEIGRALGAEEIGAAVLNLVGDHPLVDRSELVSEILAAQAASAE
jgi:hypothetical protein